VVRVAKTSVEGRYVCSGDSEQHAAYTIDLSQSNPVSNYLGSAATRQALHPSGPPFSIAHTADDIFNAQDPNANVFNAINTLRLGLLNNDTDAINAALANFGGASSHLNDQLAFY